MNKSISTFPRFLYLNIYAFLILLIGGGISVLPLYKISWWLVAVQAAIVIPCLKGGIGILQSWGDKKRKYHVLMERNKDKIRPDTFESYMEAPCGRLLVRIVLKDLGKQKEFKNLKVARKPLKVRLKESCTQQKTVVHTFNIDNNQTPKE
jgi:hypothetical protein